MIEVWREALRSLPSETFLDLMRTYLGQVRTPYRKHELIEELATLLKKKETSDRILSFIDEDDAACLSAIMVLNGPDREGLLDFLGGDRSQAMSHIVNLEERLLIFEAVPGPSGKRLIHLNPILAKDLKERAFEPSLVFPPARPASSPGDRARQAEVPAFKSLDRLDPAALAAMVSFFLQEDHAPKRKADGELKLTARAAREFAACFPTGWECLEAAAFLEAARLFRIIDGKFSFSKHEAEGLFRGAQECRARAAAIASGMPESAALARCADQAIPAGKAFSREAMARFIVYGAALSRSAQTPRREAGERLVPGMVRTGILRECPEGGYERVEAPPEESPKPELQIGSDFHMMAGAAATAQDLLVLAQCLDLSRLGAALEFSLTRKSAARAYRLGMDRESLEAHLKRMSGQDLPQNVAYSLEAWEREHHSVNIVSGIVISGDERLSRFMEHSPAMKEFLVEKIAPGAYLTSFSSVEESEEALRRAGMETPPRLLNAFSANQSPRPSYAAEKREAPRFPPIGSIDWERKRSPPPLDASAILADLNRGLEASSYPKETKEALAERIRLKLIIGEAGLRPDSVRYERSEAGGLDYLGKVKLIEHALHEPNWLLDILYRDSSGQPVRRTIRPVSMHKSASGLLLEGTAEDGLDEQKPNQGTLKIPVEKVANVKRVRLSLFG
jgi:hypothetical protein